MIRRRFLFWVGFGLFSLSEKLRADGLDELAASAMRSAEPIGTKPEIPVHWTPAENKTWRWFEREHLVNGEWKLTGITTPIHKKTGQRFTGRTGYVRDELVPVELRGSDRAASEHVEQATATSPAPSETDEGEDHQPDLKRRANHGRPPSKWLRSLYAAELRIWLKTIDVPEAGVAGMTYWEHLTRDHSFEPTKIAGLTIDEQAKLHGAAHFGY